MAEMTSQDMAGKLLAAGFERSGPAATALSDPIADTPMIVTLDQLRPYDHDPRKKRNPAYEEIKASIRERGLDAARAEGVERDAQRQLRHGIGSEHAGGQRPQLDRRQAKLHGEHRPDDRHHRARGLVHEVRRGERERHSQQHRETV